MSRRTRAGVVQNNLDLIGHAMHGARCQDLAAKEQRNLTSAKCLKSRVLIVGLKVNNKLIMIAFSIKTLVNQIPFMLSRVCV